MDTNNLLERINRELGYQLPIQVPREFNKAITPQNDNIVNSEKSISDPKTESKQIDKPWLFKPGQSGNPKGRPKKPKDFLESLTEEFEKTRTLNPDGTPGKNAAQVLAQAAMDKAIIDKDLDAMKWIVERKYGKVPNINQNLNANVDLSEILNEARGIKIVENLDTEDGEPTIVEVK